MSKKPPYTEEFKLVAVKQVTERHYPVTEVAKRLVVFSRTIYAWIKRYSMTPASKPKSDTLTLNYAASPMSEITTVNGHNWTSIEPHQPGAIPTLQGKRERPRCRQNKLHVDKGYDFRRCRDYLWRCGIKVHIARRGIDCNERLVCHRWVVERTHGWLAGFGKLRIPFERRLDTHMPC